MTDRACVPNHHSHYPAFSGPLGLLAALSMVTGRQGDARLASRLGGVGSSDVVVDVGCGPGAAVRHAAALGASATGIDPAAVMLRVARVLSVHARGVRYLAGTAEAVPLPDEFASVLWSIATVHHWRDLDAGLSEARRVLRTGGRLVTIERRTETGARGHAGHGWTPGHAATFAARCIDHGFVDAKVGEHTVGRRTTVSVVAWAP